MKEINIIKACTDLGVSKEGAELGPSVICSNMNLNDFHHIYEVKRPVCKKDYDKDNKKKNMIPLNQFNEELFDTVCKSIKDGMIPLTVGGDHSLAIGSCLASKMCQDNIGLVWFDAHADFNTFKTTITGNIHGVPFASVTGQNGNELTSFFKGNYFDPHKCVLIGARSIDYPGEMENLKQAGIKIFTTEDIKEKGIREVFDEAIKIVNNGTEGFHFSIDTDVMDPQVAPGVSVPEVDGISEKEFLEMIKLFMEYKKDIKSIDIVEYNPKADIKNITLDIVIKAMEIIKKEYRSIKD